LPHWKVLQGKVVGSASPGTGTGILRFLRRIDAEFPGDIPLHLVMDNYGTHKHPKYRPG